MIVHIEAKASDKPSQQMCSNISEAGSGVAGSVQDILGLAHGVNLTSASLLAHIVVFDEEVAVGVERAEVLVGLHELCVFVLQCALVGHELLTGLGQRTLGISHGLGIGRALALGVLHELFVIILGIFFLELHHLILLFHVVDEVVNHLDDAR